VIINKNLYNFILSNNKYLFYSSIILILSIILMLIEAFALLSLASLGTQLANGKILLNSFLGFKINISLFETLLIVLTVFIIKNLMTVLHNFIQTRFFSNMFSEMSTVLFKSFIHSSYQENIKKKPSELIRIINSDISAAIDYIFFYFSLIKEFLIVIGMLFIFYFSDSYTIIFFFIFFSIVALFFYKLFKNFLINITKKYVRGQTEIIKLVSQTFGSLKENHVYNNKPTLIKSFNKSIFFIKYYNFYKVFIASLSKPVFEIIAITAVVFIVIFLSLKAIDPVELLNKIILVFVVALRSIPSFNAISSNFTGIKVGEVFFNNFYLDVEKVKKSNPKNFKKLKLSFKKNIKLEKINFKYSDNSNLIIRDAEFVIEKNKSIGIYGQSGSGKTTFVDYILGLIYFENEFLINNKKFSGNFFFDEKKIGYVPQDPYLLEDTIKNNIIFGRERFKISNKQVLHSVKLVKLTKFINSLPFKLNTVIGNNGSNLSGGQKQRIVLARALLLDPEILVLDEATNALDTKTENLIINEILSDKKNRTIILISHKMENIKKCDIVYKLSNGILKRTK
jgi:ABC-type multidrug transport system fused ATPase/permease subunit